MQFYVSNYMGPELTDILSSLTCIVVMVLVITFWKPKTILRLEGDKPITVDLKRHSAGELVMAWLPYLLLVVFVLLCGNADIKLAINRWTDSLLPAWVPAFPAPKTTGPAQSHPDAWPPQPDHADAAGHRAARSVRAVYELNWLSASGTACSGRRARDGLDPAASARGAS